MPSRIDEIMPAIAATFAGLEIDIGGETRLLASYDYLPAAIDDWPAHVLWIDTWRELWQTQGGMRLGWTLTGMILVAPLGEAQTEQILRRILAALIDALHHNLTAAGTLPEGQVTMRNGGRQVFTLAGVEWQAQKVIYFVEESFPYEYALGTEGA